MPVTKLRNISGGDRAVPLPNGGAVVVEANHQAEFDADHAKSLLEQSDVWEKVKEPSGRKDDE